jgi:maltooligosyltrehalose trehalohydrolase
MGEEYGELAPFLYFTSHNDPGLADAVRKGRREEFAAFAWEGDLPDPQNESTFLQSKLDHQLRDQQPHRVLWDFYQQLIRLRKTLRPLRNLNKDACRVGISKSAESVLFMRRWWQAEEILALFNLAIFGDLRGRVPSENGANCSILLTSSGRAQEQPFRCWFRTAKTSI